VLVSKLQFTAMQVKNKCDGCDHRRTAEPVATAD